jgi:sugar phosphate isomerase/epimerase
MPVRLALDRLAAEGYRAVQLSATHVELRPRELDASARRGLKATLRRMELQLAGMDAFLPLQHWSDEAHVDRAFTAICDMITLAGEMDRVAVSVLLPRNVDGSAGSNAGAAAPVGAVIEAIVAHANREGVVLVDYALPARNDIAVAFGLDAAAAIASNLDPAKLVHEHRPRSVRLTDLMRSGVRGPIGDKLEGQLDVMELKVALSVSGYAHPIVVDTRQWRDPFAGLRRTRDVWESV